MDETTRLWLWLNYATNRDPRLFYEILSRFDALEEAYEAVGRRDFSQLADVRDTVRERLCTAAEPSFLDRYCGWLQKNGVTVVTAQDDAYPAHLSEIYDLGE